jgi:hypothetical protein
VWLFQETYPLHHQGKKEHVSANIVHSSLIVTLMKKTIRSSDMSVLTRATRHDIPQDGIIHSHRRENLKS